MNFNWQWIGEKQTSTFCFENTIQLKKSKHENLIIFFQVAQGPISSVHQDKGVWVKSVLIKFFRFLLYILIMFRFLCRSCLRQSWGTVIHILYIFFVNAKSPDTKGLKVILREGTLSVIVKDQCSHLVYLNINMHKITNLWKL